MAQMRLSGSLVELLLFLVRSDRIGGAGRRCAPWKLSSQGAHRMIRVAAQRERPD